VGTNNRQRRAAKAKRRSKEQRSRHARHDDAGQPGDRSQTGDPLFTTRELVEGLLELATAPGPGLDEVAAGAAERLCTLDHATVSRESERHALRLTAAVWNGGWQPVELIRQVQRTTNAATTRLALVAISADHARRSTATLDPRWIDQLDRLELPPVHSDAGWLDDWAEGEQMQRPDLVRTVVAYLRCLASLSQIPILVPPPGTRASADATIDLTSRTNDPILDRIRALLAQAESTTFEAEAEAFTAKAQQLMTRHAVDQAVLASRADRSETPLTIRIPIDDPYVDAKSLLLQCVAENTRCRSVFHERYAMSSVVGFAGDVAATEMLFTSLLVQAQTAMHAAAASSPAGARTRSRSFRAAFLVAYANRIGERLAAINEGVITEVEVESNRSILPVLSARSHVVDASIDDMFGELRPSFVRAGHDVAGSASGHLAAERAQLTFGDLVTGDDAPREAATPPSALSQAQS